MINLLKNWPPWVNRKVCAWALYDFADQAFSVLFITFFFPIFIKVHLGGNEFQIGLAMGLAALLAGIVVPVLGALSDATGRRIPILAVCAATTAGITVIVGYMDLAVALILGSCAYVFHLVSKGMYNAKMIDVAPPEKYGAISGLGLTLGYTGTVTSLAVAYLILSHFGWEELDSIRALFLQAGIWYVLFSLPLFFMVPDIVRSFALSNSARIIKNAFVTAIATLKSLPRTPVLGRFLAASFLYNNAMSTIVIFFGLFGREVIGLGIRDFFSIFVLMAVSAGVGAFVFGHLSDQYGPGRMIKLSLGVWIAVVLTLIIEATYATFLIAGMIGGLVFGGIWTLNRHMIARISPKEKIAETFGFEGLTGNLSGTAGPIIFGALVVLYGYTAALVSTLVFFLLGMYLMRKIRGV
jgi:UMF1 family MFS transporter